MTSPTVSTSLGPLEGRFEEDGRVAVFKGIPYAKPPVGDLRWRPPQPAEPWSGVRPAHEHGPRAIQRAAEFQIFLERLMDGQGFGRIKKFLIHQVVRFAPRPPASEDCLYLNVRTPSLNPDSPLPVMVWIHGGAHQDGSGSDALYASNALVDEGVVLVTLNYRLGVMGFFAHPELSAESPAGVSGNYGGLDQIAALQWVQDNIAAFGGDPNNVTIFGESAGAESVLHLAASPLAAGLFHKAIAQSPATGKRGVRLKEPFLHHKAGEDAGVDFARQLGAAGEPQLEQLRALTADEIQAVARSGSEGSFYPLIDGHFLPKGLTDTYENGDFAQVPLLIGSNGDESTLFYIEGNPPLEMHSDKPHQPGVLPEYMRTEFEDDYKALLDLYPGMDRMTWKSISDFQGDMVFGFASWFYAMRSAAAGQPTYLYQFRRLPKSPKQWSGAFHAAELPFVHGSSSPVIPVEKSEEPLGVMMRRYWTNFAKTGDPNGPDLPHWPTLQAKPDQWMLFDSDKSEATPIDRTAKYRIFGRWYGRLLGRPLTLDQVEASPT